MREILPGGLVAHEVCALCPDEMALHLPELRALAIADGVVRAPGDTGPLGFVPDSLMDELLAHGGPVLHEGRAQLEELVASGGRTAFEL